MLKIIDALILITLFAIENVTCQYLYKSEYKILDLRSLELYVFVF